MGTRLQWPEGDLSSFTKPTMADPSAAHHRFVLALQHEPVACGRPGCPGPVEVLDTSRLQDRVKSFSFACTCCNWNERTGGTITLTPPWDEAAVLMMAEAHLLHEQPSCPFDNTPIVFTSLPNPRRKARYRLSCFYCGRQAEMDWPPRQARL